MASEDLLRNDGRGLWCEPGGFHVDPWDPVRVAVITHAHGDHARGGSDLYYCANEGLELLRRRLPAGSQVRGVDFGEPFELGSTCLTLHPAGHIRGSSQVRVETGALHQGGVWVVSGDYKRQRDATCTPFEVVPCNTFITEATFGLPIYRWEETRVVAQSMADWWQRNRIRGWDSIIFAYSLGKAQRILSELWSLRLHPDYNWIAGEKALLHGAMLGLTSAYVDAGVELMPFEGIREAQNSTSDARPKKLDHVPRLALAPPSAAGSPWMRRFGAGGGFETGFASGWMRVRGVRRRRGYDRGFVISDHIDWPDMLSTIAQTGATRVLVTHGSTETVSRYLCELGIDAAPLETRYSGEAGGEDTDGTTQPSGDSPTSSELLDATDHPAPDTRVDL